MKNLNVLDANTINKIKTGIYRDGWWIAGRDAANIRKRKRYNNTYVLNARKSHAGNFVNLLVAENRHPIIQLTLKEK